MKIMEDFNEGVDGKLASRLRRANSEQFFTLVKMHLSFELDINTEDNDPIMEKVKMKKWSLPNFSKKPKSVMNLAQKGSEGATLTPDGINQVKQLIEYLSQEQCINQEGIFRRTGKLTRQQELKLSLYQGQPLKLNDGTYSVHDCASVLKCFLAELPEPLLTELHYPAHCQIADLCTSDPQANESRLLRSLQLLLLLLPPANRVLLKYLLILLHKTAAAESSNKMNCDTLATLFTPHLMCPRKLSPEALHINSQNLSGLVAFMIRKGAELIDIPPKLATDIRAYWVEQERRLLSPRKQDLNESISDTTGTAHTVFSFVDHKLTAKANSAEDTSAALAQLYAHIQALPESAKKRRLVKQFNKQNGQGTPRHVKQVRTKSLGESIKKHIFQNKILGSKKFMDINIGCNISRSSSEENIFSGKKTAMPGKKLFSKSDDELSADSFVSIENENLVHTKNISLSTGSLDLPSTVSTSQRNFMVVNVIDVPDDGRSSSTEEVSYGRLDSPAKSMKSLDNVDANWITENDKLSKSASYSENTDREVRRFNSEPLHLYSSEIDLDEPNDSVISDPVISVTNRRSIEIVYTPIEEKEQSKTEISSPAIKNKIWGVYGAHTSTPSTDLLRRSLANNDYGLTPIVNNDKSMSPITQSTSKMPKSMQETMMTPRSRKPVMMISGTNLCNLASLDKGHSSGNRFQVVSIDIDGENDENNLSIIEEGCKLKNLSGKKMEYNKDSMKNDTPRRPPFRERNFITSREDANSTSITSTFREYLRSRSVLTASPVDLSFTSRTGDFEQSESDLNVLNEEGLSDSLLNCLDGNNPSSDTSGIASGSTNSANESVDKTDDNGGPTPRKRGTSLQRNDSKRSIKNGKKVIKKREVNENELNDSALNSSELKDTFQETSF